MTGAGRPTALAFITASFVAAFLLFLVEPMFAKMALPLLGGSSDVWTVCVLFYQCTLLAAYLYAHTLQRLSRVRDQALVHGALCALALLWLPITLRGAGSPPAVGLLPWLLGVLVTTVGLPFFVLSAMSPLFGAWLSAARHAANPYGLYAASNLGSLAALALYPVALEPTFGLFIQSRFWSAGYVVFAALFVLCAFQARSGRIVAFPKGPATYGLRRELRWVALAFIPSSLMLSVTTYISSMVAPLPLLWTVPLGLYLCTFIIVFGSDATRVAHYASRAAPIALVPLIFLLCMRATTPWLAVTIALHLTVFTLLALVCHFRLASDRPARTDLTAFYASLAAGGALGGIFSGAVAPLIFSDLYEYPLVLGLACFALLPRGRVARRFEPAELAAPVLFIAVIGIAIAASLVAPSQAFATRIVIAVATMGCLAFSARAPRYAVAVLGVLALAIFGTNPEHRIAAARNLYGFKSVDVIGYRWHELAHGGTVHGAERLVAPYEREPETYYTRSGPLGDIFRRLRNDERPVGVVGLGVGSAACYAKPGQHWTFYEIDPQVVAFARDSRYFRYLADCAPTAVVDVGDGRLELERDRQRRFGLLILDAYSSDAIPTHLLTREALRVYRSRLAPHGLIAFHLSNRYFNFQPPVAALARDAGLRAVVCFDERIDPADRQNAKSASIWMVLAESGADLGSLAQGGRWRVPVAGRLWTDDYSSIVTVLRISGS